MYTPQQLAQYKRCDCDPPPQSPDDDAAELKLSGGYKTYPKNRCTIHNMVRTKTGKCIECELDE